MSESICPSCGSCGFPMRDKDDFAGGNLHSPYCSTCADDGGALKPFDTVLELNAEYFIRHQGIDAGAAIELARALLISMPAWTDRQSTLQ